MQATADTMGADERAASEALSEGIRKDVEGLPVLISQALSWAKREFEAELTAEEGKGGERILSAVDADLIAARCARRALANVRVRFRARCTLYAVALASAQEKYIVSVFAGRRQRCRRPRRVSPPQIELTDEFNVSPRTVATASHADQWMAELQRNLCYALGVVVAQAHDEMKRRGMRSVVRARIDVQLVLRKVALAAVSRESAGRDRERSS